MYNTITEIKNVMISNFMNEFDRLSKKYKLGLSIGKEPDNIIICNRDSVLTCTPYTWGNNGIDEQVIHYNAEMKKDEEDNILLGNFNYHRHNITMNFCIKDNTYKVQHTEFLLLEDTDNPVVDRFTTKGFDNDVEAAIICFQNTVTEVVQGTVTQDVRRRIPIKLWR